MILLRYSDGDLEKGRIGGACLKSTDEESEAALRKLKDGQEVSVEMKRARSGPQHRLFFALMKVAFDNQQTEFPTVDTLRKAVLVQAGYVDPQMRLTGEVVLIPQSLSYHNMKQETFNKCFEDCVDVICKYVMPGTEPEALINEVGR